MSLKLFQTFSRCRFPSDRRLSLRQFQMSPTSRQSSRSRPKAVIFDLGGVIMPSPFRAIASVERQLRLEENSINRAIVAGGPSGSFMRMERGELTVEEFEKVFEEEYAAFAGKRFDVKKLMTALGQGMKGPLPVMVDAVKCIRAEGLLTALLTNNWRWHDGKTALPPEVRELFDEVFESAIERISKPDPKAYQLVLDRLGINPEEAVFLDDIGRNCKAAASLGIHSIKVNDPVSALKALKEILQFPLHGYVPGTKAARGKHELPRSALTSFLKTKLDMDADDDSLNIRKYAHGQSNPTFFIGTESHRMVLRKKPPGKLLHSAHAVEREFRVTSALHGVGVPVAKPLILCEDSSIIGTPFYLMEHVSGRILKLPNLPGLEPKERTAIYSSMNEALAKVHTAPYKSVGLHDYGKEGNYILRQLAIWSKQYEASKTRDMPAMDELMSQLPKYAPAKAETTIVHGDFRLDNLIIAWQSPDVLAVLDWELSTLGDPLSDLAYNCMPYHISSETPPPLTGLQGLDLSSLGIPTEDEYIAMYCRRRGLSQGIPNWNYYLSFAFFRVAAIVQGVYKRALQGQASADNAHMIGGLAEYYANLSRDFLHKEEERLCLPNSKL